MYNYNYPAYAGAGYQVQSLIRVTGIEGAKAYQMNANSAVALFDSNEDIMYIKTTDGACFPTVRQFRFTEIDLEPTGTADYITKEEFKKFKEEMLEYGKQFISKSTNSKKHD